MSGPRLPEPALHLPVPVVLLCPPFDPETTPPGWFLDCRTELMARRIACLCPPVPQAPSDGTPVDLADGQWRAHWVAAVASAVRHASRDQPLIVVAAGAAVSALPALAIAMRAARQSIVSYVLVDADVTMPEHSAHDWPAAPVIYVRTPSTPELGWREAGLRGWRCRNDPVAAVLEAFAGAR